MLEKRYNIEYFKDIIYTMKKFDLNYVGIKGVYELHLYKNNVVQFKDELNKFNTFQDVKGLYSYIKCNKNYNKLLKEAIEDANRVILCNS